MAITQRQLRELANEALQAAQAFDLATASVREVLARCELTPEAKLALLGYVVRDLPVVGTPKSLAALEHIGRTERRNVERARRAREQRERAKESEK